MKTVNHNPGMPAAERLAYRAIEEGLTRLDCEVAAQEIREKRKQLLKKR